MRVALDMQLAQGTATGIGEYARGLVDALRAQGLDPAALCEPRLDPWRFDRRVIWDQVLLPYRAARSGAQLLHCTSGTMPLRSPLPTIVTVHDVAWLKVQQHTRAYARYYFGAFSLARYRSARAIVLHSTYCADELRDMLDTPPPLHVLHPGVAADFRNVRPRERTRTIFVPGTVERRKNLEVVIRALPDVSGARLISVGPPTPYANECLELARRLHVDDRVEFRGYVSRSEVLDLYATCGVVAVPSTYEGFGYAAAQALCAGAPVLAANASSLPEVMDGGAPLLPPGDERAWAAHIEAVLDDPVAAQQSADAARPKALERFEWAATARAMLRIYASAAG